MSTAWSTEHCQTVATCMVGEHGAYRSIQVDCPDLLLNMRPPAGAGSDSSGTMGFEFQEVMDGFSLHLLKLFGAQTMSCFQKHICYI